MINFFIRSDFHITTQMYFMSHVSLHSLLKSPLSSMGKYLNMTFMKTNLYLIFLLCKFSFFFQFITPLPFFIIHTLSSYCRHPTVFHKTSRSFIFYLFIPPKFPPHQIHFPSSSVRKVCVFFFLLS